MRQDSLKNNGNLISKQKQRVVEFGCTEDITDMNPGGIVCRRRQACRMKTFNENAKELFDIKAAFQ